MSMNLFTDEWALLGAIDPATVVSSPTTATLTDAIDMGSYDQVAFVFSVGAMAAITDTVDCKVVQATTSGGTYKDVTSAAATQLTGSPSDANKQVIIIVDQTNLDVDNSYRWVKGSVTTASGTTGSAISCVAFGRAKHKPGSDADLASLDEIVTV